MKNKTCISCNATFVPDDNEDICAECINSNRIIIYDETKKEVKKSNGKKRKKKKKTRNNKQKESR